MTSYTHFIPETGEIIGWVSAEEEISAPGYVFNESDLPADSKLQYVDISSDVPVVVDYSPAELAARASLPKGWAWEMPGRVAADRRTLEETRAAKIIEMSDACANAIMAGFTSSALGGEFTYPAKLTDQANLSGSILDSLLPGLPPDWTTPFWCADAEGVWAFRPHTAAQIQQAGRDGKAAILAAMSLNEAKREQVTAAEIPEIDTIHWP